MAKTVLITGGTGFLGCHLARRFLKEGFVVTLLDIVPLDANDLIGKVTVIQADVRDAKAVTAAMAGQQYVIHAAAALPIQRTKNAIFSVNVDGTKIVLQAALKHHVKKLIFISTTVVYGVPKHLPEKETSPLNPMGYYGKSKYEAEKLCLFYQKKGLPTIIIRPKSFLGPERLGVFTIYFDAIYTNKPVFILGKGDNLYQWLDVRDVCSVIFLALTSRKNGGIFNVGAKEFGTWRSDFSYLIRQAKSKSAIISLPVLPSQVLFFILEKLALSPVVEWHYRTMPVNSYVSIEKAEKMLHWHPTKSNREILLESYNWYKTNREHIIKRVGKTHRVGWDFQILSIIKRFF